MLGGPAGPHFGVKTKRRTDKFNRTIHTSSVQQTLFHESGIDLAGNTRYDRVR